MTGQNQFEKLEVWKRSHELVKKIYPLLENFPKSEKYSLVDQLRRASLSVPTNIAEGNERGTDKEFIKFLYTSKGSLAETKYFLILASDLGYINMEISKTLLQEANEIGMMLSGLIKFYKSKVKGLKR